jgi:hypothetical protein
VATHTGAAAPGLAPGGEAPVWHTLSASVVSLALKEWETGIVLVVLTLFNAVLGLQQQGKAAASVIATGVSILTLLLATVFGPLQAFLKTTSLDARQWLICLAVALSIVVVSEIRKAVRRHSTPGHQETR